MLLFLLRKQFFCTSSNQLVVWTLRAVASFTSDGSASTILFHVNDVKRRRVCVCFRGANGGGRGRRVGQLQRQEATSSLLVTKPRLRHHRRHLGDC